MKKLTAYFSRGELILWGVSSALILISFLIFDRVNIMTLAASLIGTTSLIFNAKGNPIGQALMMWLWSYSSRVRVSRRMYPFVVSMICFASSWVICS